MRYTLTHDCLTQNGADQANADALSNTIMTAERDGSHSHGLFRLPAMSRHSGQGR